MRFTGSFFSLAGFIRRPQAEIKSAHCNWSKRYRVPPGLVKSGARAGPPPRGCFVHLDVDLYAPTLASLEYFVPRLVDGGVIICDDYGAPLFPGAHRAWDRFCARHDLPFVVLDTGQSVILKQPPAV